MQKHARKRSRQTQSIGALAMGSTTRPNVHASLLGYTCDDLRDSAFTSILAFLLASDSGSIMGRNKTLVSRASSFCRRPCAHEFRFSIYAPRHQATHNAADMGLGPALVQVLNEQHPQKHQYI